MINRSALLLRPKQPFIDWALSLDDSALAPYPDDEQTVYLVPDCDTDEDHQKVLNKLYSELFERELFDWHTDESAWPQNRTYGMFLDWFDYKFHSVIEDLVGGRIFDEDD